MLLGGGKISWKCPFKTVSLRMSSLKLIWQPFYDTLLKCQWISVRGLLLINAEIIAGYRNVGKIWVASAAAEHSFQFLWQKNFFPLHLHVGAGANIAAMESRSEDSFTPSYKWPNAADAKFQSMPISSFAQIVFLRCGILWPFTWRIRWPSDIWHRLVYKVGLL